MTVSTSSHHTGTGLRAGALAAAMLLAGCWESLGFGAWRVVDGDTLVRGELRVRLHGVDAPESDQRCLDAGGIPWRCGDVATEALQVLVASAQLECVAVPGENDPYGRQISRCDANGVDAGLYLVSYGHARAALAFTDVYAAAEREARAARRGIWAGDHESPWEYRRRQRDERR